jgi:hypothetical protein
MDIQAEKLHLIEWISKIHDPAMIEKLRNFQKEHSGSDDWWHDLKVEEMESINRGLKDFEEGRTHSHQAAREVYGKYL